MFYADLVLSKKGPLARIWLAAHWDRKLTKTQVFETNIEKSVEGILQPSVRMALRTSGHLLLGVVRIYSRKTKYLLADCNEAFVKIKMAFRPGMVDLPDDHHEAAVSAVTLPEVFHDFDSAMTDFKYTWNDVDIEMQISINQSRMNEITMREDFAHVTSMHNEDNFGDTSFEIENSDLLRDDDMFEQNLNQANLLFSENIGQINSNANRQKSDDDVSNDFSENIEITAGGIFEEGGLFDECSMPDVPAMENNSFDIRIEHDEENELERAINSVSMSPNHSKCISPSPLLNGDLNDEDNFAPPSPAAYSSDDSRPSSPVGNDPHKIISETENERLSAMDEFGPQINPQTTNNEQQIYHREENVEKLNDDENGRDDVDQSTVVNDDEETFALHPVDSSLKGTSKSKRKRKLIVDEIKSITGDEMKAQMISISDIVTTLDLAPPTKRLMHWKEIGGVEKLFALPGKYIPASSLFKNYQRFLTSKTKLNEDIETADTENIKENIPPLDDTLLPENEQHVITNKPGRRGRKRKYVSEDKIHAFEGYTPIKQRIGSALQENTLSPPYTAAKIRDSEDSRSSFSTLEEITATTMATSTSEKQENHEENAILTDEPTPMEVVENLNQNRVEENNIVDKSNETTDEIDNIESDDMVIDFHEDDDDYTDDRPDKVDDIANEQDNDINLNCSNENIESKSNDGMSMSKNVGDVNVNPETTNINHTDSSQRLQSPLDQVCDVNEGINNTPPDLSRKIYDNDDVGISAVTTNEYGPSRGDCDSLSSIGQDVLLQADNETMEEFEERVLNKRARNLYHFVKEIISTESTTVFSNLVEMNNRKQVAQRFYSLLVLKKFKILELTQDEPYGEIIITKGPNFDNPKL